MPVPTSRIRPLNDRPLSASAGYVLYWMIAARRLQWNFALQHAVDLARELRKPLVVFEALDVDYPWANDRLHRFVLDGMADNARTAAKARVLYVPFVETTPREGRGLLAHLTRQACAVVTDHYPAFFLPAIVEAAARQVACRMESVDSNGLIPLAAHQRAFTSARSYRAFVQRELRHHLTDVPDETPLAELRRLPKLSMDDLDLGRWRAAPSSLLEGDEAALHALPIDHGVPPAPVRGGSRAASRALERFLTHSLPRYAAEHNDPDADCTSRLSPYLHFGHVAAHQVFAALMTHERWTTRRLAQRGGGARDGWWGVRESANTFLDQLVVWRELAFNGCEYVPDFDRFASVPGWAQQTLAAHAGDERRQYDMATLEAAATADPIWNATQRQLAAQGWFHGYLRMLWGKKILEWSPDPQAALDRMAALMNRYSLDGRDPISTASFTWVVGRYDRPWPERPVFGTVRYMSSESARRKLKMRAFLERYGDAPATSAAPARPARRSASPRPRPPSRSR